MKMGSQIGTETDEGPSLSARVVFWGVLFAATYAFLGGLLTLAGWALNIPALTDWDDSGISMKANTAVCAMLAAVALALSQLAPRRPWLVKGPGILVALIGVTTLLEHITATNFGIDTLLFDEPMDTRGTAAPGRMGPPGAVAFTLVGIALFLLPGKVRARRWTTRLGLAVLCIASLSLVGYLYGASQLFAFSRVTGIALQAASIIAILAGGLVISVPEFGIAAALSRKDAGGVVLRRLLLPLTFLPLVAGRLGIQGQEAGWYDTNFGVALFALAMIGTLVAVVWWAASGISRTTQALQESEALLQKAISTPTVGALFFSLDGKIQDANETFLRMSGYDRSELLGSTHWRRLTAPEFIDVTLRQAESLATGGEAAPYEKQMIRKDGSRWWGLFAPMRLRGGGPRALCMEFIVDITERKQAAEALRESEERYRAFLANSSEGMWRLEFNPPIDVTLPIEKQVEAAYRDGRYAECNDAMARMYGLGRAEDLIGKTLDFMLPRNVPEAVEFVTSVIRAGYRVSDVESEERDAHGERVFFSNSMVGVVENGRLSRMWGTQRDITRRKQVEDAMRELSERFQTLADNIPALAWMANPDGSIFWFNKRLYDYTGKTWEDMQNWGWKSVHHPEHMERVVSRWEEHLHEGKAWEDTFPLRGADGEYRWFLGQARPIRDAEGKIVRWFGTYTDVTALRETQRQLSEANEQLSSRARQLNALVEKRTAELRETVQQLETFSYSIVHDMRAPLRSVRSFASILDTEYRDRMDDTGRTYLERIMASAARMDSLITDVLKYSQLTSSEMAFTRVDLDKLVTEIVEQYPQFQEAASAIHIEHPLPAARGNSALLTQVLSNLIGNALKFVPPERAPQVNVSGEVNGERVRLWVADNGIGIPPGQREKIFGLFQRLHHMDEYPGTGVGLAIVKKAVERMHGNVGVESEPGQGSRFWVELPKAEKEMRV